MTVEAASPVLIEKVRSAVTDGNGRFQIIDLRPGAYTVTFTLAGFNTVKRDGITLIGASESNGDVELRVGALEETITVTGEAHIVDTSTVTRQAVLSADTIDALPTARNYVSLARLIPSAVGGGTDVGGANLQGVGGSVMVHGSRATDQRVTLNGINTMTLQAGGNIGGQIPGVRSAAEMTVWSTGVSAELPTGGVRINFIPRDGGNRSANSTFFTFSNDPMQGSNFTHELRTAGLGVPNEIERNWDLNASFGGPFKRHPAAHSGVPDRESGRHHRRPTEAVLRALYAWLTRLKGFAVYTVPKVDMKVSGAYRSVPGDTMRLQFNASNAYLAANSTLGRALAGGAPNLAIDILEPHSVYLDRQNTLDMRFGKMVRLGRSRSVISVDMFDALNNNAYVTANQNFGAVNRANGSLLVPTSILGAPTFKFSVQFDY